MYRVITNFVDLQDNNRLYRTGDVYPRDGFTVNQKRLEELLSDKNRKHTPVIEAVSNEAEPINTPNPEELNPKPTAKRGRKKKDVK